MSQTQFFLLNMSIWVVGAIVAPAPDSQTVCGVMGAVWATFAVVATLIESQQQEVR